jgi:hypothetical protein
MKQLFLFLSILFSTLKINAQNPTQVAKEDSIKKLIKAATNPKKKLNYYRDLLTVLQETQITKVESYLGEMLFSAEESRDQGVICDANLVAANYYSQFYNKGVESFNKALQFNDKAIKAAKQSNLHRKTAVALTRKALLLNVMGKSADAQHTMIEAESFSELSQSSTAKVEVALAYAKLLEEKSDNLLAFKKYVTAKEIAEAYDGALPPDETEVKTTKEERISALKIKVYGRLADFYRQINQIEKSKDLYSKLIEINTKDKDFKEVQTNYLSLVQLASQEKEFELARGYLAKAQELGKSNGASFLLRNKIAELNIFFVEDFKKVTSFIKDNPQIVPYMRQVGFDIEANKVELLKYSGLKNFDSVEYLYNVSRKECLAKKADFSLVGLNSVYSYHCKQYNLVEKGIAACEEIVAYGKNSGNLDYQKYGLEYLDSFYLASNNTVKQQATKLEWYKIKDSIDSKTKQNELLGLEIDANNKEKERLKLKEAEAVKAKHNIQYLGIVLGIVVLFTILSLLGWFKIKPLYIRALGFLAFILLFEFIILLADHKIHDLTHGAPLPILLIKMVLIAMLLPLHHWIEHKAIGYLTRHDPTPKQH